MDNDLFQKIVDKYPFLTICRYATNEHVGIVMNQGPDVTTLYDFGSIFDDQLKQLFLQLGEQWWWESNRSIPINLFLRNEWEVFKPYLKTFNSKNLEILSGPTTSLADLVKNKRKRRSITLVRRVD